MTNHNPQTTALPIHAPEQKTKRWAALGVLMLPVLLVSIDNTVLAFAVPAIAEALSPSSAGSCGSLTPTLVLAALLVPMGAIGDRIGRRKLLLIGSTGFAAISALAAFAPSALMLVVARALLGILAPCSCRQPCRLFAISLWMRMSAASLLPCGQPGFSSVRRWADRGWFPAGALLLGFGLPARCADPDSSADSRPDDGARSKDPNPSPVDPLSILLIMTGMTGITFGLTHTSENRVRCGGY